MLLFFETRYLKPKINGSNTRKLGVNLYGYWEKKQARKPAMTYNEFVPDVQSYSKIL